MLNILLLFFLDKTLIFGTRQGHLLMYIVEQNTDEHKMELKLHNYNKMFSPKPIIQVEVIPEYQLLISLSDNVINVHDISRITNFPLVHCAKNTKGATIFALNIKRSKSLTGEISLTVRMCVGVKRKLQLWYWKHDEFLSYGDDIDLSDVPKTLLWSENTICVGFKTEYVMYNVRFTKIFFYFLLNFLFRARFQRNQPKNLIYFLPVRREQLIHVLLSLMIVLRLLKMNI